MLAMIRIVAASPTTINIGANRPRGDGSFEFVNSAPHSNTPQNGDPDVPCYSFRQTICKVILNVKVVLRLLDDSGTAG